MEIPSWLKDDNVGDATGGAGGGGGDDGGFSWTTKPNESNDTTTAPTTPTSVVEIEQQQTNDYGSDEKRRFTCWNMMKRDSRLWLVTIMVLVVMNIPLLRFALYPFVIFSTYIHEVCHGLAATMIGGKVSRLDLYTDTSGLATSVLPIKVDAVTGEVVDDNSNGRAFVAAAGYTGTSIVGMLLLIFRRTKRGPRLMLGFLSLSMYISVIMWVRGIFGIVMTLFNATALLVVSGYNQTPRWFIKYLYTIVAVTCAFNSITSVKDLLSRNLIVNGQTVRSSDAHTVADATGFGNYLIWAILWLGFALFVTALGLIFAIPGPNEKPMFSCCDVCVNFGCFKLLNGNGGNNSSNETNNNEGNSGTAGVGGTQLSAANAA